jgi:hypothetical protein
MAGLPAAVIRTGSSSIGGEFTQNRSLAGQSQFQTQATTGAMGPSSRSPLVWVGALLSLCVLVLAGAIVWTRMDKGRSPAASQPPATKDRLAGNPGPKIPGDAGTAGATNPGATGSGAATGATGGAASSKENTGVLGNLALRPEQDQAASQRREAENRRAEQLALQRERERKEREQRELERPGRIRPPQGDGPTMPNPPKAPEQPQVGRILIKSAPPFAALTVNGKPQGETPMSAFIEVPVGRCHIEIVHRLSPPFDTVINITPGFQREYKFKLDR